MTVDILFISPPQFLPHLMTMAESTTPARMKAMVQAAQQSLVAHRRRRKALLGLGAAGPVGRVADTRSCSTTAADRSGDSEPRTARNGGREEKEGSE